MGKHHHKINTLTLCLNKCSNLLTNSAENVMWLKLYAPFMHSVKCTTVNSSIPIQPLQFCPYTVATVGVTVEWFHPYTVATVQRFHPYSGHCRAVPSLYSGHCRGHSRVVPSLYSGHCRGHSRVVLSLYSDHCTAVPLYSDNAHLVSCQD